VNGARLFPTFLPYSAPIFTCQFRARDIIVKDSVPVLGSRIRGSGANVANKQSFRNKQTAKSSGIRSRSLLLIIKFAFRARRRREAPCAASSCFIPGEVQPRREIPRGCASFGGAAHRARGKGPGRGPVFLKSPCLYNERARRVSAHTRAAPRRAVPRRSARRELIQVHSSPLFPAPRLSLPLAAQ